jgi:hypothetical protein
VLWILDAKAPHTNVTTKSVITRYETVQVRLSSSEPLSKIWYRVDNSAELQWVPAFQSEKLQLTVAGDGLHLVVLWGVDVVGNVQEKGFNYTWVLDSTGPTVDLLEMKSLPLATKETSVPFTLRRNEANATVWWAVDSTGWTALLDTESSFMAYVGGDGLHVLRLKSADVLGNVFLNSTAWHWVLDTTPPTSLVKNGPGSPSLSSSAEFQVICAPPAPLAVILGRTAWVTTT